ncbi:hypothetical protein CSW08_02170 [Confluentibacter flavum]|uniref:Uncharacterized protein n=1 Tax=Confluentibacter flavum TaxID=1909700 RepID=A0A2N3HNS6_9FLAO|nr:hypothetical protein CSW08_02170 [Confluentibacter flavum]
MIKVIQAASIDLFYGIGDIKTYRTANKWLHPQVYPRMQKDNNGRLRNKITGEELNQKPKKS